MAMEYDRAFTMTVAGQALKTNQTLGVLNPATREIFAAAPDCARAELDRAVSAARSALTHWKTTAYSERQDALRAIAARLRESAEDLKWLLMREQGKPLAAAFEEIMWSAYWCEATATLELPVEVTEDRPGHRCETRHIPIGVVGAIAPWNFPVILAVLKIAPALLAGNTMVLKPSPLTPLTTLKIGEILRDVLPPGVLNVISDGDDIGPWMTAHPDIDMIAFTGSTATGRKVRFALELGGNDAAIIFPDVDVNKIAEQLFWAASMKCRSPPPSRLLAAQTIRFRRGVGRCRTIGIHLDANLDNHNGLDIYVAVCISAAAQQLIGQR
ncbi:MAG: aldehyde dehydrogenase family protein [Spongiibacteraceae bacterium]